MDFFLSLYNKLMELSKLNPVIGGAFTVWVLGVSTYLLRNVPRKLASFIAKQGTTSMELTYDTDWRDKRLYMAFLRWFDSTPYATWSRSVAPSQNCQETTNYVFGPGYGRHFFMYDGRFFLFTREKLPSEGVDFQKERVVITLLGRSRRSLLKLYLSLLEVTTRREKLQGLSWTTAGFRGEWGNSVNLLPRPLGTVVTTGDIAERMVSIIREFRASRDWYIKHGIPYKLVFMLYGPPGTGKSSIARAVCTELHYDLYNLPIQNITDTKFLEALMTVPQDGIALIEDFDSCRALRARDNVMGHDETFEATKGEKLKEELSKIGSLTQAGFLNALDGPIPLDGTVVIMTTNTPSLLDPAVVREGRCDYRFEVPYMDRDTIGRYARNMYGSDVEIPDGIAPMAGAKVYTAFRENQLSVTNFIQALKDKKQEEEAHRARD